MDNTAAAALSSARLYLNDVNQQIWTDSTLIPYMQEAFKDLLLVLWMNGLPVIRKKTAIITVPAGTSSLQAIAKVPPDMMNPIWLKERASGSNEDWQSMIEQDFEADTTVPDISIRYWSWRLEDIKFVALGASTARDILMEYHGTLSVPQTTTDSLQFIFADLFLGPQTAGYACGSLGNTTLAGELLWVQGQRIGLAGSRLDLIVRANVKGQQNIPARRIPYRRFARSRLIM